ncbi:RepA [Passion fruit chlorotic mottle virus]|uniref:Replication-associated protein n=1 Tax=Passion fruit chlorotic mottle virus TaxID=2162638 RepID=A0A2R4Q8V4_9GEMI|nr:RepA [Passion fruit chlorotic mottle virus]AVY03271.1 RepA [Passion fruit chlorotic mottle virus]
MPSTSNFRFSAKNIFLTFAQCFLPKEYILNFLKSKPSSFDIFFICVCFETHQNGDPHIHAMVQMRRRLDTTNPRFFDIKDELHDNRIFHPPFEPLRSPAASYRYIRKDNDFIEEGDFSTSRRPPSRDLQTIWRDILQISTDEDTFYRMVKEHRPMDYVLRWPAIQSFARDHFQRRFVPYTPQFIDFPNLPHHVRAWANRNILCVSTEFVRINLCFDCRAHLLTESEIPIRSMHYYYCDACRSPTQSPTGPSPSSSVDLLARERLAGPDLWDYITTPPDR